MVFRKLALIMACSVGLLGAGAASASASSFFHNGTALGNIMASGTTLMAGSSDGSVLATDVGSIGCSTNTFDLTVGASGGATVSGSVDALTTQACSDSIPSVAITGCHAVAPLPTVTATASGASGGTIALNGTYLRCDAGGTSACYYYAATASGGYANTGGVLTYNSAGLIHTVPSGGTGDLGSLCGTSGSFSTTFTDVTGAGTTAVLNTSGNPSTYLHGGTTTGSLLSAGTTLMARSNALATFTLAGVGTITCATVTVDATVGASGGADVTGSLDGLTFGTCSDTIPVITYTGCHLVTPLPAMTVTATGTTGGTMTLSGVFVRCNISGGTSGCYEYIPTAAGNYSNTGAVLAFSNVSYVHTVPAGGTGDLGALCGTNGTLGVGLTGITVGSSGATVVLNQTP